LARPYWLLRRQPRFRSTHSRINIMATVHPAGSGSISPRPCMRTSPMRRSVALTATV